MRIDQQIRINELLLQREELFLRVHAAEAEIARILGEPLALPRPPLPSERRGKRRPSPGAVSPNIAPGPTASHTLSDGAKPRVSGEKLRRLEDNEHAYRVTYRQFGRDAVEIHYELSALATLVASQGAQLQVERIETVDAIGAVRAVLA